MSGQDAVALHSSLHVVSIRILLDSEVGSM